MIKSYPKTKTVRDKKYLKWLRTQRCSNPNCMHGGVKVDVVATHTGGAMALKGDDSSALPLCFWCHAEEHMGALTFWKGTDREQLVIGHRKRYRKENA